MVRCRRRALFYRNMVCTETGQGLIPATHVPPSEVDAPGPGHARYRLAGGRWRALLRHARVGQAGDGCVRVAVGQQVDSDRTRRAQPQGASEAPAIELIAPDGKTYTSPRGTGQFVRNRDHFYKEIRPTRPR